MLVRVVADRHAAGHRGVRHPAVRQRAGEAGHRSRRRAPTTPARRSSPPAAPPATAPTAAAGFGPALGGGVVVERYPEPGRPGGRGDERPGLDAVVRRAASRPSRSGRGRLHPHRPRLSHPRTRPCRCGWRPAEACWAPGRAAAPGIRRPEVESYGSGVSSRPLLGETIGANLARTVAAPGDREALVVAPPGRAAAPTPSSTARSTASRAALLGARDCEGDRVGIWSPNYAEWMLLQYATAEVGVDPRQHQPGLPHPRARVRAAPVGLPDADRRAVVQDVATTSAMVDEVRADAARPGAGGLPLARRLGRAARPAPARRPRRSSAARRRALDFDDADQHPVHVGHDRLPEGRHAPPPQHPEQRLLRRRGLRLHRGRPGVHPGALLPLLRHGDGQPRRAPRTAP